MSRPSTARYRSRAGPGRPFGQSQRTCPPVPVEQSVRRPCVATASHASKLAGDEEDPADRAAARLSISYSELKNSDETETEPNRGSSTQPCARVNRKHSFMSNFTLSKIAARFTSTRMDNKVCLGKQEDEAKGVKVLVAV
uniref:Uncharacterized protein n=1 Tax=Oryza glumipatula TaxID=40148 RepID=A0A0D9ZP26_9ORYZ